MIYGSVCSGIEAASVAWHPLGWRAAWLAEIERFPSEVLAHHYPDVPNLGDMTTISDKVLSGDVAAPDILVGGTPCQAFSVAGLRGGLKDPRGALTISFVELANAIDTTRSVRGLPESIIVWENVPGVLSSKDNAFGCFLGALAGESCELQPAGGKWADAGCVFGSSRAIAWRILDAQYFGVAQRRRRVFVVSSARDGFDPAAVLFEFEGLRRDIAPSREAGQNPAGCLDASAGRSRGAGTSPAVVTPVVCMAHGQGGAEIADNRSPTLTCNHEAPIVVHGAQDPDCCFDTCATLDARTTGGGFPGTDGACGGHVIPAAIPIHDQATRFAGKRGNLQDGKGNGLGVGKSGDPCPTLTKGDKHAVAYAFAQNTRDEVRLVGGDGQISGALAAQPGMKQTTYVATQCVTGDVTHTLKAEGFDASEDGTGRGQPIVPVAYSPIGIFQDSEFGVRQYETSGTLRAGRIPEHQMAIQPPTMQVRRLTPRECERLQGFPDDYTLIPLHQKKPSDALRFSADGPRYKALGNSMAVPCMAWIGARIQQWSAAK